MPRDALILAVLPQRRLWICAIACILSASQVVAQQNAPTEDQGSTIIGLADAERIESTIEANVADATTETAPLANLPPLADSVSEPFGNHIQSLLFEEPAPAVSRWYDRNGWDASLSFVTGQRDGETILARGVEQETGIHQGFFFDLRDRVEQPNSLFGGWSGSLLSISGEDTLTLPPIGSVEGLRSVYGASLISSDANAMIVSHYKNRIRRVALGVRAIIQEDSLQATRFPTPGFFELESANKMIGPQIGIEQFWHSRSAFSGGFSMKSAVLFNHATSRAPFEKNVYYEFPVFVEYSAKAAYRFSENGQIGLRVSGMVLTDQHFAVDRTDITSSVRYLSMALGFQYQF